MKKLCGTLRQTLRSLRLKFLPQSNTEIINIMTENEISYKILDAAYKVHTALGPGLLESSYQAVLVHELKR